MKQYEVRFIEIVAYKSYVEAEDQEQAYAFVMNGHADWEVMESEIIETIVNEVNHVQTAAV